MINMLIALMNKAHSTPEQISNVNKEMEILRKYKKRNARGTKCYKRSKECL